MPKNTKTIAEAYAYCPHCGANNPAPGIEPFKCGACGFASFFGPVAAVGGLILNRKRELLLVRRARDPGAGKWGLPGGFIDAGETVEEALCREVAEETGLEVTATRYLVSYPNEYNYRGVVAPVIDFFYECWVASVSDIAIAKDELDHFQWTVPNSSHLRNMAFRSNRLAIEYWLS